MSNSRTLSDFIGSSGTPAFTSNTTFSANVAVTGATTLSNTVAIAGATTFANTVAVTGDTTITGTVQVGNANASIQLTSSGLLRKSNDSVSLYNFNAWTFTPAGATGRNGPSLANVQSAYTSAAWASNTSNLTVVSGVQKWTVPKTGLYRIQAAGAPGGKGSDGFGATNQPGGNGVILSATFYLMVGDILYILVGQHGGDSPTVGTGGSTLEAGNGFNSDTDGGGGGGTFVAKRVTSAQSSYYFTPDSAYVIPLIVAGGGNGAGSDSTGPNAIYGSWAAVGAPGDQWGYGTGGGWSVYPTDASTGLSGLTSRINTGLTTGSAAPAGNGRVPRPGSHFLAGGTGGVSSSTIGQGLGGFGGGGGATDEGGAGGGGWIGGISGDGSSVGGSSYVSPDASAVTYDGYVAAAPGASATATTNDGYCVITYYGQ